MSVIKSKIADELGMPPGKQKLQIGVSLLNTDVCMVWDYCNILIIIIFDNVIKIMLTSDTYFSNMIVLLILVFSASFLQTLFIKDSNTLGFYNFTSETVVLLGLKERGGRRK